MHVIQCEKYTLKNAQLVTNLQQTCSKSATTTCWQDVLARVVPSLLTSCYKHAADLLQAWWTQQPACYKLFQQNLHVIGLQVNKLVTSLLRAQLVDKSCVFACVATTLPLTTCGNIFDYFAPRSSSIAVQRLSFPRCSSKLVNANILTCMKFSA